MSLICTVNDNIILAINDGVWWTDFVSILPLIPQNQDPTRRIRQIALSPDKKILAFTTEDKHVLLYSMEYEETPKASLIREYSLSRSPSGIRFNSISTLLAVCDKFGDAYVFDCEDWKDQGRWILGHMSMLLDIMFTKHSDCIISCDRDEKIRVSQYPDTEKIHVYCLGHLEYVSAIEMARFNTSDYLISASGDKTMRIWHYIDGSERLKYDLPEPAMKMRLKVISLDENLVALSFHQSTTVNVYSIKLSRGDFKVTQIGSYRCAESCSVYSFAFNEDADTTKLVIISFGNNQFHCALGQNESKKEFTFKSLASAADMFNTELIRSDSIIIPPEQEDYLFKKKYDNMEDFIDRKKRKIDNSIADEE